MVCLQYENSVLLSKQAAAYHNLNEIEVVGAIIYTGTDAAARQTSTIFGGLALVQDMLSDTRTDVCKILDRITVDIKYVLPYLTDIDR
jgi:hypothetical protein